MGSLRFRRFKKKKKVPTGSEYQLPVWPICDQRAAETSLSSILAGAQTVNILGSTERPRGRKGPSQGGCRASPRDSQEDRPSQSPRAGAPRRARSLQWGGYFHFDHISPPHPDITKVRTQKMRQTRRQQLSQGEERPSSGVGIRKGKDVKADLSQWSTADAGEPVLLGFPTCTRSHLQAPERVGLKVQSKGAPDVAQHVTNST